MFLRLSSILSPFFLEIGRRLKLLREAIRICPARHGTSSAVLLRDGFQFRINEIIENPLARKWNVARYQKFFQVIKGRKFNICDELLMMLKA